MLGAAWMDASTRDATIVAVVVALRLTVPLLIPVLPLPAIVTALVIDGVDQTAFQSQLTPSFWHRVEDGYQGYDKALDVYYLSLAYVATMRNWTNRSALRWAQFLWLYRLAGVTVFEIVHDPSDPASWRWLLLVFPNTFEYFFIAYETIRLRWDPRRLGVGMVTSLVAFIWIVIKLPQEWWIHVARLDVTDFAAQHAWVVPTVSVVVLALIVAAWWAVRYRLTGADWSLRITADALPEELATAAERGAYRALHWRLFDTNLAEKLLLVSLVCVDFAQILPESSATPQQVIVAVATLVVINSAASLAFVRHNRSIENSVAQFAVVGLLNLAIVWVARMLSPRFDPDHAMFFVLLISLIVVLYDRYRPVRNFRLAEPVVSVPGSPHRG
jgi:hypothetical protein